MNKEKLLAELNEMADSARDVNPEVCSAILHIAEMVKRLDEGEKNDRAGMETTAGMKDKDFENPNRYELSVSERALFRMEMENKLKNG